MGHQAEYFATHTGQLIADRIRLCGFDESPFLTVAQRNSARG